MAKTNEITTKFSADVSNLKAGIKDANRQIKLANAEFKAASSAMDFMADSAAGIQTKLTQLGKVYDGQNKILEAYKKELEQVEKEQGENSAGAENLRIKIANQQAALNKTAAELKDYNDRLKDLEKGQEGSADAADDQIDAFSKLGKTIDEQEKELKDLKDQYANVVLEQGKNSDAAKELAGKITDLSTELAENKKEFKEAGDAADEFDKTLDDTNQVVKETGDGFTVWKGVLADLAATGIKAVVDGLKNLASAAKEAWKEFDSGADNVIKATGATGEELEGLQESYKKVSKSIVGDFGDIGSVLGEVNTRFGTTGEELEDMTTTFLKFSDITGADAVSSVQSVAKAMKAAGYQTKDYSKVLDALAVSAQKSGISTDTITGGLEKYGSIMRTLGYDVEETIAMFAQFELAGVNSSTAFAGLQKAAVNFTKDGKDAKTEIGKMVNAIANIPDDTAAAQKAMEVFGNKAGPELADAIRSGRFEYTDFLKAIEGSEGVVERTFEATQNAPDKLKLAMQSARVDLAEVVNNLLTKYAPQIEKAINAISKGLQKVIPKIIDIVGWVIKNGPKIAAIIGGIAAAIAAMKATAVIMAAVAAFRTLFTTMAAGKGIVEALNIAFAANPIGLVISLIAGLVAAFVILWNTSEDFRNFFIGMWEAIKETVGEICTAIVGIFKGAWEGIKNAFSGMVEFFTNIWNGIKLVFSVVGNWFKEKFETAWALIKAVWDVAVGYFTGIWNGIKKAFETVKSFFEGIFTGAWTAIKTVWDGVTGFFEGIWKGIKDIFSGVAGWFEGIFTDAKKAVETVFEGLLGVIKAPINALIDGLNIFIKGLNKIKIPSWVPGVGGKGLDFDTLDHLERGGVLKKGQMGLLEGNGAEAVVPLERNRRWINATAESLRTALESEGILGGAGGRAGHITYETNYYQTIQSPKELSQLEIYRNTQNLLEMTKGAQA